MDHCEATSENGIFRKGDTRISDLSGRKILPVGNDNFTTVVEDSVFIDKSLLIADILDSGSSVTLFCRPRRFGKSLNLSMLQRFFEEPLPNDPLSVDTTPLFEGLRIWDTDDGRYREHHGACPVVRFSFNGLKRTAPIDFLEGLESAVAAYTHGYYSEAVDFLKSWLTGALKGNDSLAFACLTGVQRISKESIFSDLNNLTVNTSMSVASDERYGFTQKEIEALAEYLGHTEGVKEAKRWYDGYRFGAIDVYNPWSALNYFRDHCTADVYWGNTSSNSVLATLLEQADEHTTEQLFALMQPGGAIEAPLDLSVVFPDIGTREEVLWSMLYLAGYLTTNDVELPNNKRLPRTLRIPNREIAELYRTEIVERYGQLSGGPARLAALHRSVIQGNASQLEEELSSILLRSASYCDLDRENSYHMLMLGLLMGIQGYEDPLSDREAGQGRFDILLTPCSEGKRPIIMEFKRAPRKQSSEKPLSSLALRALEQIDARAYAAAVPSSRPAPLCYGIAFCGKNVAVACSEA